MADTGFAIRCPHCGCWNVKEDIHPSMVAVSEEEDILGIMRDFQAAQRKGRSARFSHPKMFRCPQPRWACPVSYEAFIFHERAIARESLKKISRTWAISRDFRLYKINKQDHWDKPGEGYHAIMFVTESVPRLRHVELEHLLDARVTSKLIAGIGNEIEAPLTVYSGNVLQLKGKLLDTYWMPIEDYSGDTRLVPARFNVFCDTCRAITIAQVEEEFKKSFGNKEVEPKNCQFRYWDKESGLCGGVEPACRSGKTNWHHCPGFLDIRKDLCFCYNSDVKMIEDLRRLWCSKARKAKKAILETTCPVGFTEIAMPIAVHNRLLAVATSGQFYWKRDDLLRPEEFVEKGGPLGGEWDVLAQYKDELETVKHVLFWQEENLAKQSSAGVGKDIRVRYWLTDKQSFQKRIRALQQSVEQVEEVAAARYRDLRSRSEMAFRGEMMGYIEHNQNRDTFFTKEITHVFARMREFWAFKAVGLLQCPRIPEKDNGNEVYILGFSPDPSGKDVGIGFGTQGKLIGRIDLLYDQEHPLSWLYDPYKRRDPKNEWVKTFFILLRRVSNLLPNFYLPTGRDCCYFLVMVPSANHVYAFVFIDRNEGQVTFTSEMPDLWPKSVSELGREFMLRTCTEIIHELHQVKGQK